MAAVDVKVLARLDQLITEGEAMSRELFEDNLDEAKQATGWITATDNVVSLCVPNALNPYRSTTASIVEASRINVSRGGQKLHIARLSAMLARLKADIADGLLSTVADQARAGAFDDLLEHAEEYLKAGRKEGSGVLTAAVFEDTLRRIGAKHDITTDKVEDIISELVKLSVITEVRAKRCRAATGLRNSALHAKWDEYDLPEVGAAIKLARELIDAHLDA